MNNHSLFYEGVNSTTTLNGVSLINRKTLALT